MLEFTEVEGSVGLDALVGDVRLVDVLEAQNDLIQISREVRQVLANFVCREASPANIDRLAETIMIRLDQFQNANYIYETDDVERLATAEGVMGNRDLAEKLACLRKKALKFG